MITFFSNKSNIESIKQVQPANSSPDINNNTVHIEMACPNCKGILESKGMRSICSYCGSVFENIKDELTELVVKCYPNSRMMAIKLYKDKKRCSMAEAVASVDSIWAMLDEENK